MIGEEFNLSYFKRDSITLFKKIYLLNSSFKEKIGWEPHAVLKDETFNVCIDDILSARIIDYQNSGVTCGNLIDNYNKKILQKLIYEEPHDVYLFKGCFEADLQWVYIVSYNEAKSEHDLVTEIDYICCSDFNSPDGYQKLLKGFTDIQNRWSKEDIFVFRICCGN